MSDEIKQDATNDTEDKEAVSEEAAAPAVETAPAEKEAAETSVPEAKSADGEDGSQEEEVEVPEKFKKLVEEVENMTVIELSELVKVLEKKFGVSATAVAAAAPSAAGAADGEEEKSTVTVELTDIGASKIAVIKAVKSILELGLKEAKDLVDGVPSVLKENIKKEEADELKAKIEEAGGKVVFK